MTEIDIDDLAHQLKHEHAELFRHVQELRNLLGEAIDWPRLETALATLEQTVLRHFDFEEAGGYLDEVLHRDPNHEPDVIRLQDEHRRMRDALCAARHLAAQRQESETLRELFEDWFQLLRDHEERESRLMQLVFNTDVGAGD